MDAGEETRVVKRNNRGLARLWRRGMGVLNVV